ncbi:MAG: hypothetical protein IPK82_29675 [Polyangiaceae bacterium]|nr:hypothetical protein [Polyangiaceae bacterium]
MRDQLTKEGVAVTRLVPKWRFHTSLGLAALFWFFFAQTGMIPVPGGGWSITHGVWLAIQIVGLLAVALLISQKQKVEPGILWIGSKHLFFNHAEICTLADIRNVYLAPKKGAKPLLVLQLRRGRTIRLGVDTIELGHAIAEALELDPTHRVATFHLPTFYQRLRAFLFFLTAVVGFASLGAAVFTQSIYPLAAALIGTVVYLALVRLARSRVEVAADGVRLSCLGKRRFIAHGEIESAEAFRTGSMGVHVKLQSGETVVLPTATHAEGDGGLSLGIADMINTARKGRGDHASREESLLVRRGRTASKWLVEIRRLAAGANADHRTAPIEPDQVWRVLENPAADPSARIGAAAVLVENATEADRDRLRIAAKAVALPNLRIAMEGVVSANDEQSLVEALEAVEERKKSAVRTSGGSAPTGGS